MIKKILSIAAMLTLLTGCVCIDSKYTGRSRMRIRVHQNDYYYVTPLPVPYYGWVYVPYGYHGYPYWYGNYAGGVYPRKQAPVVKRVVTKKQLKSGSTKSTGTRTRTTATKSGSSKTKVKNK